MIQVFLLSLAAFLEVQELQRQRRNFQRQSFLLLIYLLLGLVHLFLRNQGFGESVFERNFYFLLINYSPKRPRVSTS